LLFSTRGGAAVPAFEDLLESSDAEQLMDWGKHHQYGVRVPQNIDLAIQLYCRAARLGHAGAQFRLGEIYSRRLAGKQDEVLAAAWLLQAAAGKSSSAKQMLTRWDLSGTVFPTSPECVLSDAMVARTLPRAVPVTAAAAKPAEAKPAKPKLVNRNPRREEIALMVQQLAPTYRLDPELVLAVIEVESNFNPRALSPKQAQGLMQLIPATAKRFGVADPYDPHQNLQGGMAYLRWLLDHFNGDLKLALAGYNAGEGAVARHGGVPPFKETQNYVRRIASVLGVSEDRLNSHGAARPSAPAIWTRGRGTSSGTPDSDWETRFFETGVSG
jgi:soluble lytic murein transglycosylase-like protein